ncbi:MAG: hypothetical protein AB1416_05770, partial [Actinomycetota bacterium]
APPAAGAGPAASTPRWYTRAGALTAGELADECRARGVRLDRARRVYWQAEGVFPRPEVRRLTRPQGRGGARGYYHRDAPDLAWLVDFALRRDHPVKTGPWRASTADLAALLAGWWAEADAAADPLSAERAFYERVRVANRGAQATGGLAGLAPHHRPVIPPGQERVEPGRERDAESVTAGVVAALADDWLAHHAEEPPPDRLVVWFRVERCGPDGWRIVDTGARRTAHDPAGRRHGGGPGGQVSPLPAAGTGT